MSGAAINLGKSITRRPGEDRPDCHVPALDGLRGVAILMVLVFHFWQSLPDLHLSPTAQRALSILSIGQKGVDLFFVLSGFLITGILLRTKLAPHYFRNFYTRRALRIFPLYYAVLITILVWTKLFATSASDGHPLWPYFVYLQNIVSTFGRANIGGPEHFWSLAVEEHFYLFWPLAIMAFNRRHLVIFAISLIIGAFVCRAVFVSVGLGVFTFTLCRMDALALGALLAVTFTEPTAWATVQSWAQRLAIPMVLLSLGSFFAFSGSGTAVLQITKFLMFDLLCALFLVLSLSQSPRHPVPVLLKRGPLRFTGKISYGIYVFHPFIYGFMMGRLHGSMRNLFHGKLIAFVLADFALVVAATILVSWFSWVLLEQPLLSLKEQFAYGTAASLSGVVVPVHVAPLPAPSSRLETPSA